MNKIITISREFGSGGREIGLCLANELHVPFYDKEIITIIVLVLIYKPSTKKMA